MSSRVRLTARDRSGADQTPYPGNVNQPDRKDPDWEDYHTFEQKVNHELPDMRKDWQNDSRDDLGFGIPEAWGKSPTVASARIAANKAVRVAVLLLGEKVSDDVLEAQARDLMSMSMTAMDRTIQRFAETQDLYAADEKEEVKEEVKASEEKKEEVKEEVKAAVEEKKEEVKVEEKTAASEAQFTPKLEDKGALAAMIKAAVKECIAEMPDFIKEKIEDKKEDKAEKKATDEKPVEEKKEEVKASDEKEVEVEASESSADKLDVELSASMDDEVAPDPEADKKLASILFGDDQSAEAEGDSTGKKVEASKKKVGIKKLGFQPRLASTSGAGMEISDIWESAPDVGEVFK
jgi:hypothetical protein